MIKKEYLQPAIVVLKADTKAHILIGSAIVTDVVIDLGDDDITLPSGDDPSTGTLWDDTM